MLRHVICKIIFRIFFDVEHVALLNSTLFSTDRHWAVRPTLITKANIGRYQRLSIIDMYSIYLQVKNGLYDLGNVRLWLMQLFYNTGMLQPEYMLSL